MGRLVKLTLILALAGLGAFLLAKLTPTEQPRQTASIAHPLDPYPGFGRGPAAALRDESLAVWDAYRQEALISECMASQGFEYQPEVSVATFQLRGVVRYLDLQLPEIERSNPGSWNHRYVSDLGPRETDEYYRALFDESAADMRAFQEGEGTIPPGNPPSRFMQGGCSGEAEKAIPIVWEAQRSVGGGVERIRTDVLESPVMERTRSEFRGCMLENAGVAAEDPGRAEELIGRTLDEGATGDLDALTEALEACMVVWDRGYRSGEREEAKDFIARNRRLLDAQRQRYVSAKSMMLDDHSFIAWLAAALGS